jgi:tetratricopeptide (TPR) repeat protein
VLLRLLERCAGAGFALVGLWVATARSLEDTILDDRPAPWILHAILVALGVFLLHNLVDFSMFEVGPMFLFALLAGAALGMRQWDAGRVTHSPATPARRRVVALAIACVAWLVAAGALFVPVAVAEADAGAADEFLRTGDGARAAQAYHDAAATVPYNGDYSYNEARVLQSGPNVAKAREALDAAIRANPYSAGYRFSRGHFEATLPQPDPSRVRADYERGLALDPANVPMRLDYAKILETLHLPAEAKAQYETALWYDDQLAPDEIERLAPAKVAEIRASIARLGS